MRPSPEPANLTYIAFRREKNKAWLRLQRICSLASKEILQISRVFQHLQAPTEDITVSVERDSLDSPVSEP